MAPVRESTYFPPLDKCLDGRHQLLYVYTLCARYKLMSLQIMESDIHRAQTARNWPNLSITRKAPY